MPPENQDQPDREWFHPPAEANDQAIERVDEVNEALAEGQAVTLEYDFKHHSRHPVFYWDQEDDVLIWSPHVDGQRRVLGYKPRRIGGTALNAMVINIAWSDDLRISPLEETELHHETYGHKPIESIE